MASLERFTELMRVVAADDALRARLEKAGDAGRAGVLASIGFTDITDGDASKYSVHFQPRKAGELNAAELATVAGGAGNTITTTTTTTTVTASASAAAAP